MIGLIYIIQIILNVSDVFPFFKSFRQIPRESFFRVQAEYMEPRMRLCGRAFSVGGAGSACISEKI